MSRDIIEDLALIAHPPPHHDEINFDNLRAVVALERKEYAEKLQARCAERDEDPLLAELRSAADRRDRAEARIKSLLAYGRHFTGGSRPGYSWPVLAEAAGLDRKTAERRVSDADIAAVRAVVDTSAPAQQTTTDRRNGSVTFNLHAEDDLHFVLTEALREFASRQRDQAAYDEVSAEDRTRWADVAEAAATRVDAALA